MSEAIDWLREEWPYDTVDPSEFHVVSIGVTQRDLIRAIDEYDAAAAAAGRLMAEVAELRRTIVGMGDMIAALYAERNEWKRRAENLKAEAREYREVIAWHACCPDQAQAMAEAFDAYQREQMLRDLVAETAAACAVWRKRAEAAEAKLANLRPHPEDEAGCAEGMRQAEAGEGTVYTSAEIGVLAWEDLP